jgi:hypothetical protein
MVVFFEGFAVVASLSAFSRVVSSFGSRVASVGTGGLVWRPELEISRSVEEETHS